MERVIKVGNATVGLVGLEGAVNQLKKEYMGTDMDSRQAATRLLELIRQKNYVPATAEDAYIEALERVWKKAVHEDDTDSDEDNLRIRILGPGCVSCDKLERMVLQVMSQRGIAADIEHVRELDEIWRFGVIQTPALVVGKRVLCSGRMPTVAQIESWFTELFG